jgi:hypothetical protein
MDGRAWLAASGHSGGDYQDGGRPKGLTSIGFFIPGRGHVLGDFAFCDASFPSGFSFWKAPRGSVSEGTSWSEARAQPTQPAPIPTGTVIGSTTQATNSAVSFTNPTDGQGSLLIHLPNGKFVACERACTHQGA